MNEQQAIYRFYDASGALLYIGRTYRMPALRWREHKADKDWWPEVASREVEWVDSKLAVAAERSAILAENPRYNRERFPVKARYPIVTPPVWEPLPEPLRKRMAKADRRYVKTKTRTDRLALGAVIYEALLLGCRPMAIRRVVSLSQDQINYLIGQCRAADPALPPIPRRYGNGRKAKLAMKAAITAS